MKAVEMAKILQDLLVQAMDKWNMSHPADPLRKLPWDRLDPVSKMLYAERCAAFLEKYEIKPKEQS